MNENQYKFSVLRIFDASGNPVTEYYTDDDGGSGLGDHAKVQYWVGPHSDAPATPPGEWHPIDPFEGPDRTDPGYWLDNR